MVRKKRAGMRHPVHVAAFVLVAALILQSCVRLVSPYSADLQKRASDMVAEVAAWDASMRSTSGPIDVAGVKKSLATWNGEVVAMAGIAAGLDPRVIPCDRLASKLMGPVASLLPADLKAQLPPAQATPAASPSTPPQGCEASMFTTMSQDLAEMKDELISFCGLAALKDDASASPTPAPVMTGQCRALFGGNHAGQNGPLVDNLLRDLNAVVYLETRKNASAPK